MQNQQPSDTCYNQLESKMKEKNPFIMATKKIKYLRIYLRSVKSLRSKL